LLLSAWALVGMPLAVSPALAWESFGGTFIRCVVIFIVMVNAVRTERRLRWLLLLAVLVSCWLSLGALNDYRSGNLTVEGYRVGSSAAREGELVRSLWVAIRRPVFGVGMGNYVLMSFRSQVTHNAYTQVASELGAAALVCYLVFVVAPLRRMARVARETLED